MCWVAILQYIAAMGMIVHVIDTLVRMKFQIDSVFIFVVVFHGNF